ncbi:UNVERIFIED_CONTAM: hypothetical protein K2H54_034007 [Gekko kuhli]
MVLVLMLLCPSMCKVHDAKSNVSEPFSSLFKYYEEGDLIIGGISSFISAPSDEIDFKEPPNFMAYDMPLWIWIGLIVVDDERGERFLQAMLPLFSQNGICLAFIQKILQATMISYYFGMMKEGWNGYRIVMESKANTVVLFGDTDSISYLRWAIKISEQEFTTAKPKGKVYIMSIQMDFVSDYYQRDWDNMIVHGAISLAVHTNEPPGFHQFLQSRKPLRAEGDGFLREFWEQAFLCQFSDSLVQKGFNKSCTGEEKMESLPGDVFEMSMTGTSYSIYNAVYFVAHALHDLYSSPYGQRRILKRKTYNLFSQPSWQVAILGRQKTMSLATEADAICIA